MDADTEEGWEMLCGMKPSAFSWGEEEEAIKHPPTPTPTPFTSRLSSSSSSSSSSASASLASQRELLSTCPSIDLSPLSSLAFPPPPHSTLPVLLVRTPTRGLSLFASRRVPKGSLLYTESPTLSSASTLDGRPVAVPYCSTCCKSLAPPSTLTPPLPLSSRFWPPVTSASHCSLCGSRFCSDSCSAEFRRRHGGGEMATKCCDVREVEKVADCCGDASVKALTRLALRMFLVAIADFERRAEGEVGRSGGVEGGEADGRREGEGSEAPSSRDGDRHPFSMYCGSSSSYCSIPNVSSLPHSSATIVSLVHSILSSPPSVVAFATPELYEELAVKAERNAILIKPCAPVVDYFRDFKRERGRDGKEWKEVVETIAKILNPSGEKEEDASPLSSSSSCSSSSSSPSPRLSRSSDSDLYALVGVPCGSLFPLTSKFNHSCAPSCVVECGFRSAAVDVRAARDIEEGEELSIGYVETERGRAGRRNWRERRRELKERYDFWCLCSECEKEGGKGDCCQGNEAGAGEGTL